MSSHDKLSPKSVTGRFARLYAPECTDMRMLVGVVLRPMLMAIGMVVSLSAFNNIMQIVNAIFAPAVAGMTDASDNSFLTMGVYIAIYISLAYTPANSAFKLIDMLPNLVMTWIGARLEARSDDASAIQQQAQQYSQTLAYSNRAGEVYLGGRKQATADINSRAHLARNIMAGPEFQATATAQKMTQQDQLKKA